MRKPYSVEQLRNAINTMLNDAMFSRNNSELILQHSRLSRIEKEIQSQTITEETKNVELRRLFLALESLAVEVGIYNFLEFVGLSNDDEINPN